MKTRCKTTAFGSGWALLAAALVCFPVLAEDVAFEGRTLEVESGQEDARTIVRIVGSRHQINATTLQIIDKARVCLGNQTGVAVEATEAESDQLVANSHVDYRAGWSTRSARSRILVEATDGYFRIVQSGLGVAEMAREEARDGDYGALQQAGGWEKAVSAMIEPEQTVIDCLYR